MLPFNSHIHFPISLPLQLYVSTLQRLRDINTCFPDYASAFASTNLYCLVTEEHEQLA